jgi:hypothetical protein
MKPITFRHVSELKHLTHRHDNGVKINGNRVGNLNILRGLFVRGYVEKYGPEGFYYRPTAKGRELLMKEALNDENARRDVGAAAVSDGETPGLPETQSS